MGLCAGFASAHAGPILQVDVATGQLTGAKGVDVGGTPYDVEFVDGTCVGLFPPCTDSSSFSFRSEADALLATTALFATVLRDGPLGQFDSDPSLTRGCASISSGSTDKFCGISTPYRLGFVPAGPPTPYVFAG